jgi:hypothetical protein
MTKLLYEPSGEELVAVWLKSATTFPASAVIVNVIDLPANAPFGTWSWKSVPGTVIPPPPLESVFTTTTGA